jgi:hypothetical protein
MYQQQREQAMAMSRRKTAMAMAALMFSWQLST